MSVETAAKPVANTKNNYRKCKAAANPAFGVLLMLLGVFGFLVIIHRAAHYVYEFDAQFSPRDYGRFNFLSFFTVESNIFVSAYLVTASLAVLGSRRAQKLAFNPLVGALVTTYIIVTGIVYCCGIPLGFTPPYTWDTPTHSILSFIQIFHHMIIPPLMLLLWFFPLTSRRVKHKKVWLIGIYPLVYSVFSIVRGAVSKSGFYPYPFYRPEFFWDMLPGERAMNIVQAYLLMLPVLVAGIGLFVAIGRLLILINDRRTAARFPDWFAEDSDYA